MTFRRAITILLLALAAAFMFAVAAPVKATTPTEPTTPTWWNFQCIDTMKYSRDRAREFLGNPKLAATNIEWQTAEIAKTGATHIAIATPYDEEFIPILTKWVEEARKHNLKVWYRGNWSGWEEWFGYARIGRAEHLTKTAAFITAHPELFEDGDYFTACPECENGGPGDPRRTGDAAGHKKFLIDGHNLAQKSFAQIDKKVDTTLNPMNGDVARLIMDKETTKALGGVVSIDHYVKDPQKLADDIIALANQSGGTVVLGEFGAPIPDINGSMTEAQQAAWIEEALAKIVGIPSLTGMSYWTNVGGSTQIWNSDGSPRAAVQMVTAVFTPKTISSVVIDQFDKPVANATIMTTEKTVVTNEDGTFTLPYLNPTGNVVITSPEHQDTVITWQSLEQNPQQPIVLTKNKQTFFAKLMSFFKRVISK